MKPILFMKNVDKPKESEAEAERKNFRLFCIWMAFRMAYSILIVRI